MDLQTILAYRPEQFQFDFTEVFGTCCQQSWLPGYRGLMFAPQHWLHDSGFEIIDLEQERQIERQTITFFPSPLWEQLGFGFASYSPIEEVEAPRERELLPRFRLALIQGQLHSIQLAVEWCHDFLSSRTIGHQKLGQHPAVVQGLGRMVRDLYALKAVDCSDCLAAAGSRSWLIEEIDGVCEQLIKLAGGRAMLSGQMVQLRTFLLTMNRLYLED